MVLIKYIFIHAIALYKRYVALHLLLSPYDIKLRLPLSPKILSVG